MATRLYLRSEFLTLPTTEQSTALPVGTDNSGSADPRELKTTKGALQVSATKATLGQTAHQDGRIRTFRSDALAAQTIDANTWTIAIAVEESNGNANAFLVLSLYVWRPSTTSVVGFIYDSDTTLGVEWTTAEDGQVVTFSGSAVTAASDDVLICEVWYHSTQGMAASYNVIIYFDGATDVTDTTTTDAASYIETPQNLTFGGASFIPVDPCGIAGFFGI